MAIRHASGSSGEISDEPENLSPMTPCSFVSPIEVVKESSKPELILAMGVRGNVVSVRHSSTTASALAVCCVLWIDERSAMNGMWTPKSSELGAISKGISDVVPGLLVSISPIRNQM